MSARPSFAKDRQGSNRKTHNEHGSRSAAILLPGIHPYGGDTKKIAFDTTLVVAQSSSSSSSYLHSIWFPAAFPFYNESRFVSPNDTTRTRSPTIVRLLTFMPGVFSSFYFLATMITTFPSFHRRVVCIKWNIALNPPTVG
jgi:hypothetical protein